VEKGILKVRITLKQSSYGGCKTYTIGALQPPTASKKNKRVKENKGEMGL